MTKMVRGVALENFAKPSLCATARFAQVVAPFIVLLWNTGTNVVVEAALNFLLSLTTNMTYV